MLIEQLLLAIWLYKALPNMELMVNEGLEMSLFPGLISCLGFIFLRAREQDQGAGPVREMTCTNQWLAPADYNFRPKIKPHWAHSVFALQLGSSVSSSSSSSASLIRHSASLLLGSQCRDMTSSSLSPAAPTQWLAAGRSGRG